MDYEKQRQLHSLQIRQAFDKNLEALKSFSISHDSGPISDWSWSYFMVLEILNVVLEILNVVLEILNVVLEILNVVLEILNVVFEILNVVLKIQNCGQLYHFYMLLTLQTSFCVSDYTRSMLILGTVKYVFQCGIK